MQKKQTAKSNGGYSILHMQKVLKPVDGGNFNHATCHRWGTQNRNGWKSTSL
jgi:hypothetical protein